MSLYRLKVLFPIALGVVMVGGVVFGGVKVHHIRKMQGEIARLETSLSSGQDLWREFPPFQPGEKRAVTEAHERLLQRLPDDKDIPRLLEEVSRFAHEHHLSDLSMKTDEPKASKTATAGAVAAVPPTVPVAAPDGPVASVPVQATFSGDYREIAYFLSAVQDIPRLLKIEAVSIRRAIPLVQGEVSWKAYYRNGHLGEAGK